MATPVKKLKMTASKSSLKILCWNIWFDPLEFTRRNEAIIEQCIHHNPDAICFQEAIPRFVVEHVMKCPELVGKLPLETCLKHQPITLRKNQAQIQSS